MPLSNKPTEAGSPISSFINEGATNRFNSDVLRITAYLAWSLENTGNQGPAVEKAKQFIENHMNAKMDAYTLAVVANFAVDYGKDRDFTRQALQLLLDARTEKDEQAWWSADETGVYSTGSSANVETTGLAVQALLKWGEASGIARKAMSYIASKKDASGTWGTTQATIMALRALLLATEKGAADVRGTLQVLLNGETVEKLTLTPENNDLLHQFVFKSLGANGANTVEIRFEGKGGLAYQVVGSYFLPWDEKPANEPLSIDVAYDRARLTQDDIATATATIRNNLPKAANMVMVDFGIPPGFDLLSEDLQAYIEKARLLVALAEAWEQLRCPGKSIWFWQERLPVVEALGDLVEVVFTFAQLGNAYGAPTGDCAKCFAYWRLAELFGDERMRQIMGACFAHARRVLGEQRFTRAWRKSERPFRLLQFPWRAEALPLLNTRCQLMGEPSRYPYFWSAREGVAPHGDAAWQNAVQQGQRDLQLIREQKNKAEEALLLADLGCALDHLGQSESSLKRL